jgi:parallel beta-helix repeat protein
MTRRVLAVDGDCWQNGLIWPGALFAFRGNVMTQLKFSAVAVAACVSLTGVSAVSAQSVTAYVDANISASSCTNYSPETRSCGAGSATAYRTLAGAASAANPGAVIGVRGGTYREALNPTRSGTAGQPIVFRRHLNETPTITGVDIGLTFINREYIEVDGFTVTDVNGWARLQDARNITLRNSTFRRAAANGTTGSIKLVRSTYNRILGNIIDDGNDNIVLVDAADRNVIQDNTFTLGRHSLMSMRCSSFNVVRSNTFDNASQKAIEVYDCEGVGSDNPMRYDASHRNLFELNQVIRTRASSQDNDYNAIQHGAQQTIVRRNLFRNNDGGGVNYAEYADEARYVYGNRLYHNTFYANKCYAIIGDTGTSNYRDQRVKNNILYRNVSCSGGATQTRIPDAGAVVLTSNAIETSNPGFVNEAANDFNLASGSRMIDAAAALTNTTSAGSGTTAMTVQDASYFYAGHGIPGEVGDAVQIMGRPEWAVVTAINYTTNTLTLDRPLTWSSGDGLTLRYSGVGPDMGAFEFGSARSEVPSAPTNLRIVSQ